MQLIDWMLRKPKVKRYQTIHTRYITNISYSSNGDFMLQYAGGIDRVIKGFMTFENYAQLNRDWCENKGWVSFEYETEE